VAEATDKTVADADAQEVFNIFGDMTLDTLRFADEDLENELGRMLVDNDESEEEGLSALQAAAAFAEGSNVDIETLGHKMCGLKVVCV